MNSEERAKAAVERAYHDLYEETRHTIIHLEDLLGKLDRMEGWEEGLFEEAIVLLEEAAVLIDGIENIPISGVLETAIVLAAAMAKAGVFDSVTGKELVRKLSECK